MTTPLSPTEVADQFTDLITQLIAGSLTADQFQTAYTQLWSDSTTGGTSIPLIGAQVASTLGILNFNQVQAADWWAGSPTAVITDPPGQPAPGWYPLTSYLGIVVWQPCPALMVAVTQKGDPARNDVGFSFGFGVAAKEIICGYVASYAMTFVAAACRAYFRGAPAANAVIHIKKNMPPGTDPATWPDWGTITITAGSHTGTFSLPTPTLVAGDFLDFVAPYTQDTSLADGRWTLAGN